MHNTKGKDDESEGDTKIHLKIDTGWVFSTSSQVRSTASKQKQWKTNNTKSQESGAEKKGGANRIAYLDLWQKKKARAELG